VNAERGESFEVGLNSRPSAAIRTRDGESDGLQFTVSTLARNLNRNPNLRLEISITIKSKIKITVESKKQTV
jgi:hypothetical protein